MQKVPESSCSRKNTAKQWIFEGFFLFWNIQCDDQSFRPFSLSNNFNPRPLQVQLALGEPPFASAANQINDRDFVAKSLSLF